MAKHMILEGNEVMGRLEKDAMYHTPDVGEDVEVDTDLMLRRADQINSVPIKNETKEDSSKIQTDENSVLSESSQASLRQASDRKKGKKRGPEILIDETTKKKKILSQIKLKGEASEDINLIEGEILCVARADPISYDTVINEAPSDSFVECLAPLLSLTPPAESGMQASRKGKRGLEVLIEETGMAVKQMKILSGIDFEKYIIHF